MGKSHRDNHAARKKRGDVAFEKKKERRAPQSKCTLCGTPSHPQRLDCGLCPRCLDRGITGKIVTDQPMEVCHVCKKEWPRSSMERYGLCPICNRHTIRYSVYHLTGTTPLAVPTKTTGGSGTRS